jgi:glycosyltransferase involved in cell wall biosynthesis
MRVFINPQGPYPTDRPVNGIQQVINAQYEYGPDFGWEIVDNPLLADVVASHAGSSSGEHTTVAHCHGLYPTGMREFSRHYSKTNMRVVQDLRNARAITVPSQWVADILRRDMHLSPHVVPHGIDMAKWPERSVGPGKTIVWNKNRDVDVCDTEPVVEAARILSGYGFETVSTFGKGEGIRTIGVVPFNQMKDLLYSSHIYLATTRETFGIATLEAMAAGLPIVGYDWGASSDIVTQDAGILVSPGDVQALCDAVAEVENHWNVYSQGARARAYNFPWRDAIAIYNQIYDMSIRPHPGPMVTIGIPCFNYAHMVHVAINSVAAQTCQDFECIIVNDGSTDGSGQIIEQLIANKPKFRLINKENGGVASARNIAGYEAKGKYIAFLDADDAMDQRWLDTTVRYMENQPLSTGLAYTGILVHIYKQGVPSKFRGSSQWPNDCNFSEHIQRKNQVPTLNLMRREAFLRAGGFRQRFFPAEDADLWTRIGSVGFNMRKCSDEDLFIYSVHDRSATSEIRTGGHQEPDWMQEHPWKGLKDIPFASILPPADGFAHPVRDYDQPEIAVVIPVGDGHEGYALHAVDSVESQTFWKWELIVVDDTAHQSLELPGRPFAKLLRTGGGKGPSVARNMGGNQVKAPLLIFLDADDYLLPDYMEYTLHEFSPSTFIYTDWYSDDGSPHQLKDFDEEKNRVKGIAPVTFLHETDVFRKVRFDESLDGWEDWDYTIGIAAIGCCGYRLPEPLFIYRTLSGSRREDSFGMIDTLLPEIRKKWKETPMGCRGCGGRRAPRTAPRPPIPARAAPMAAASIPAASPPPPTYEAVQVRYIGRSRGRRLIKNPDTGTRYRYDSDTPVLWVRPEDAAFFEGRADFEVMSPPPPPAFREEHRPEAPPVPVTPENPEPVPTIPVPQAIPSTAEGLVTAPPVEPDVPDVDEASQIVSPFHRAPSLREFLEEKGVGARQINALENANLFEEIERLYSLVDQRNLAIISGIGKSTADKIADAVNFYRQSQ